MEKIKLEEVLGLANDIIWGPVMLALLLGVGVYLTLGLKAMPWRKTGTAFALLWKGRESKDSGDITPFEALMTALSATIGTGNIAGVATAIALGGPGGCVLDVGDRAIRDGYKICRSGISGSLSGNGCIG